MTSDDAEKAADPPDPQPDVPVRILVVDDRPENLLALGTLLEGAGRTLVLARSGREALRELLRQQFALVLLDVNMPGMDGFETAQLIRRRPTSEHTPIILHHRAPRRWPGVEVLCARCGGLHLLAGKWRRAAREGGRLRGVVPQDRREPLQAELLRRAEQRLRRRAEERLRRADEELQVIVESVSDTAIFSLDADGRIASWNAGAERLFGFSSGEVVGRDCAVLLPEPSRAEERHWRRARAAGRAEVDTWFQRKDGERFFGRGVVSAMRGDNDRILGYSQIVHDVTLRRRAEEALARHAEELQTANRLKDEFLAVLSHELRTPLNAIIGWTHILRKEQLDPERSRQGLEAIARNGEAQLGLISDILDVSRFIAGKVRLTLAPVDVREAARAAVDTGAVAAHAKGLDLTADVGDEPLTVSADAERLQQIIWNLVSNAVKFTPPGGHVSVATGRRADKVVVSVSDDGIGIAPSFVPHVFERFRQADSSSARTHGGLGLGLAIVRHLVELHGGSVRVESEGEGKGTTLEVELPGYMGEEPRPLQPAVAGAEAAVTAAPDDGTVLGVRCLIVDDDPDAREMLKTALERRGLAVTIAHSSAAALEHIASADLLIADIGMPDEDGYVLIRRVRSLPAGHGGRVPAIALTAYASERDRHLAIDAGFDRHLTKPVQHQALLQVIVELLKESSTAPSTERT